MNYNSHGYYVYTNNGALYCESGIQGGTYTTAFPFSSGSLIGAKIDKKGNISFFTGG
jgi:hypothetical protein